MLAGLAGALLVFTGIWHATEWMMDGRRRDTSRLVPVGLVYLTLGILIISSIGGMISQIIGLLAALAGGAIAVLRRKDFEIRRWVTWVFIVIDAIVVVALALHLVG